jgi:mono/diheme cytochrome c family protein
MNRRSLISLCTAAIIIAASTQCATVSPSPRSASQPNPFAGQAGAVAAGRKLFRYECAQCHGAAGAGSRSAPSLVSQRVTDARPGALFIFLTNGNLKHGMPSWSRLPEERRWQLVTYLKSLEPTLASREQTPPDPDVQR